MCFMLDFVQLMVMSHNSKIQQASPKMEINEKYVNDINIIYTSHTYHTQTNTYIYIYVYDYKYLAWWHPKQSQHVGGQW